MSEKRKWFDRREELFPDIKPITYVEPLTREDIIEFLDSIKLDDKSLTVFALAAYASPAERLKHALRKTGDLLTLGNLPDRDPPGLEDSEYNALLALERGNPTMRQREVAQLLLCVHERYNFIRLMAVAFRKYRGLPEGDYSLTTEEYTGYLRSDDSE